MKRLALVSAASCALLLTACATTPAPSAEDAGLRPVQSNHDTEGQSGYGQFLAGQKAQADGQNDEASSYFARAEALGAETGTLKHRIFQAALFSGDVTRAAASAPGEGEASVMVVRLGLLTRAVEALAVNDAATAKAIMIDQTVGFPHRQASVLLTPWVAAAAGDEEGAVARPVLRGDRLVEVFGLLGQAQLLERFNRLDEAEANYRILMGFGDASAIFAPDYGAFLERRKRAAEAVVVYDTALKARPGDPALTAARERAAKKRKAPAMPTIREGSSRALLIPASAMLADKQYQLALAYLRLSARLDPKREELWLELGDVYTGLEDAENARSAYAQVKAGSREYTAARSRLAWSLQAAGDSDKALKMAAEAAAGGQRDALLTYADLLRANQRYAESVTTISRVIEIDGDKADWRLFYMRGVSRERAGDWPGAEADLQKALAQQPDEPELLNFLGYAWIDRGQNLGQALDMVQRAVSANPRSGAMIDSLGWAYFRMGDYRNAVDFLERAVTLEPADPDINDHLGDAYWQVGRQIEARFQWTRVLQLKPDAAMKAKAEAKLANGLTGVTPVVAER
ncbi:tetratricopeptide repeat protein [Caulobacter sp. NIBR1757]|uniref:tetratricopeptide repeat protein n=1 Tax=Caulobacter sp. NIBR1757 TaxID=3016000 RepID=UPI0022F03E0E|nr:tetratricopeptide repeat protein [Caulobacter sp. NIBR1757]WGM40099.1 Beta-barrel assembly-enhancing protease [Caulobacter sp. NIBR1757]